MKQIAMRTVFLLLAFIVTRCAQTNEQRLEALLKPYSGTTVPGAAVMLIKDGAPLLIKTVGMANLEKQIPVTRRTNFRLASVTKAFTAMSVLQLVEQGKLTLRTTLGDVFPDFPPYGRAITIEQLLHHTSGLLAYEDLVPDTVQTQILDQDILELMKQQDSTYFKPGTEYRYSNTGYAVLAVVVQSLSGQRFAQYLRQHIFMPLGMDSTVAYEKGISRAPCRALGYTVTDSGVVNSDQSAYSAVLGDGGIYSNLNDLFKWDQALYTNRLAADSLMRRAFTPFKETYGFGWRIDQYKGHKRIHHTGSTSGFRNVIQRFPEDRFTVIILTNRAAPGVRPLAEKIVDWYLVED